MSAAGPATFDDMDAVLTNAGYTVVRSELAGTRALLAETPYSFVGVVEIDGWEDLTERVSDLQAALTHTVEEVPSARDWDLYLVIHVLKRPTNPVHQGVAGKLEADTRYTRKLVRVAIAPAQLDRALRPLLPLRPAAQFDLVEPLNEMRKELQELKLDDKIADAAVAAFRRDEEVQVR
jgi:hypothetical protein